MADFRKSTLREYFESIVIAVILALFIRTFVVQAFKIPTGSMEENLLIGDHLLVNKFVFGRRRRRSSARCCRSATIERGDIVVFKYPEEPDRDFIKRVIGLPGETVECATRRSTSTASRWTSRTCISCIRRPAIGVPGGDVLRRPRALRPGDRAGEPLLRDGRQPRQLAGQPLLGLPAARTSRARRS